MRCDFLGISYAIKVVSNALTNDVWGRSSLYNKLVSDFTAISDLT